MDTPAEQSRDDAASDTAAPPGDDAPKDGPKRPYGGTAAKRGATPANRPRRPEPGSTAGESRTKSRGATNTPQKRADGSTPSTRSNRGEKAARDGVNRGPADRSEVRRKGWGSVANRGVERALIDEEGIAQNPVDEPEAWEPDEWIDEGLVRGEAVEAVARATDPAGRDGARGAKRKSRELPPDLSPEDAAEGFEELMPAAEARRAGERLASATKCFEREQYIEAQKTLQPLAYKVPMVAPVRELLGLTFYRLGKWKRAIEELEAFTQLTGSTEQHPVLADCQRALGRHREVERLWDELRAASPGAALMTEGRIVMAGMMADRGKIVDAIKLLEKDFTPPKSPQEHQLRRMYVLADLYDRSGEIQRASRLFGAINKSAPGFADVDDRIRALQ